MGVSSSSSSSSSPPSPWRFPAPAWRAARSWPPTCSTTSRSSRSSLVEKRRLAFGDERSLRLTPGLTEGTETIAAYVLLCLVPQHAAVVVWVFTGMVLITVGQRLALARRALG
jgi:hypothetical protein